MGRLAALVGYSKTGKDTAALNMEGWHRMAFADPLKADLSYLLYQIGCNLKNPHDKELARPLLVAWGATARGFIPDFWIKRWLVEYDKLRAFRSLHESPMPDVIVTDVRYVNEAEQIMAMGGKVFRIERRGYGPANDEEANSIKQIEDRWPDMTVINNSGTPEELGVMVLGAYVMEVNRK